MPERTDGQVVFPVRDDEPDFNIIRDLGKSIDTPGDVADPASSYDGIYRGLTANSSRSFSSGTTLQIFSEWTPDATGRTADQGDVCGITLNADPGSTLTVSQSGHYYAKASLDWQNSSSGSRVIALTRSTGDVVLQRGIQINASALQTQSVHVSTLVFLEAGESLQVRAFQNSGSALGGGVSSDQSYFTLARWRLM